MKILSIFTFFLLCSVIISFTSTKIAGDGKVASDFECQICRDFVRRVVFESESPRTACRPVAGSPAAFKFFDGCHFMLKQSKLISKLFDLRSRRNSLTKEDTRDVCHVYTKHAENNFEGFCPSWMDTFGPINKLHDDAAGWDIRVAPAASWMNENSYRITVVDNIPKNHSASFLNQFSYNEHMKFFATDKVVHTGVFPVNLTGGRVNITLGTNAITIPIKTAKQGHGIRAIIYGDPCFSGEYIGCRHGKKWGVLEKMTQLFNTLAKQHDALDLYGLIGDVWYDPLLTLAPQFYHKLNAHALGIPSIIVPGNHDLSISDSCKVKTSEQFEFVGAPTTWGTTYMQYYGQNTLAAHQGGPASPFNFTNWDPAQKTVPDFANFFSTMLVGNIGFVAFNGGNSLADTEHQFKKACKWVNESFARQEMQWVFVFSHWADFNCMAKEQMFSAAVRDHLVTLDGCKEHENKIKWLEGHVHDNKIIREGVGFRTGGAGMGDLSGTNFGPLFIDSTGGSLKLQYFPIANETDNGTEHWNTLMSCVNEKSGLHNCYHLSRTWLSQT